MSFVTARASKDKSMEKEVPRDPQAAIAQAAKNVGLELSQRYLKHLVHLAETPRPAGEAFFNDGLTVTEASMDKDGKNRAKIDFTLSGMDTQLGVGFEDPLRNTYQGIRALRDYMLLADAGFIETPDVLYGQTNPSMAKAAEKLFGFSEVEGKTSLQAPFESVHNAVFSERVTNLHDRLARHFGVETSPPIPPAMPTHNIQ